MCSICWLQQRGFALFFREIQGILVRRLALSFRCCSRSLKSNTRCCATVFVASCCCFLSFDFGLPPRTVKRGVSFYFLLLLACFYISIRSDPTALRFPSHTAPLRWFSDFVRRNRRRSTTHNQIVPRCLQRFYALSVCLSRWCVDSLAICSA